jgi:hypothetical protein
MTKEAYIQAITDLLQKCSDPDLLDLIYKLLLQETGHQAAEVF